MAILFDFYESPPREGEEDKLRVYARPVLSETVGTEKLAEIIHMRSTLTVGDIYATLKNLGKVISEQLRSGQRVYLEDVGYFSVALECGNIETKKDMRANNVTVKSVRFRPEKRLKNELLHTKVKRTPVSLHSHKLTNEEVDRRVAAFLKENPVMVRRNFQQICQMKQGISFRHIHRLLDEGKIKNIGTMRQPIYTAVTPDDKINAENKTVENV